MGILAKLKNPVFQGTRSEEKLAAFIVEHAEDISEMTIATLANKVGVSQPTVNRFCTSLGLKGFPDFKLNLATELARNQPRFTRNIAEDDTCEQVISKVFENTRVGLQTAQHGLNGELIEHTVTTLKNARTIVVCGLGASGPIALDAHHKLMRFDVPVIVHTDTLNQHMAASALHPDDVLLCISFTGRTVAMLEVAHLGSASGACVIGMTFPESPLAKICNIVLPVESGEDTDLYTPMASRIVQLVIFDVLATRLAMVQGAGFSSRLQRMKNSLASTKL